MIGPVHGLQESLDTRQHQIAAGKGLDMAQTGKEKKLTVRHAANTFLVLCTDQIILSHIQQTRHSHGWQDLGEARALKPLGSGTL